MSLPPHKKLWDPGAWQWGPIHVYILPISPIMLSRKKMSCVELNSVTWICSLLSYSLNAQPKTLTTLGKQRYITQVTSIPCLSSAVDTLTLPSPDSGHHTDHVKVFRGGFSVIIPRQPHFIQFAEWSYQEINLEFTCCHQTTEKNGFK